MTTALELLLAGKLSERGPLCAVYGDDDYLRREVLLRLKGQDAAEFFAGRDAEWRDVHDALTTVSLFGDGADLVVVEEADKFVTEYRDKLEAWVAHPQSGRTLILEVKTWTSTTRLAKATSKVGLAIDCGVPKDNKGGKLTKFTTTAKQWLTQRAKQVHQVTLDRAAVERLFDRLPLSLGVMDQEVAKLALLAPDGTIDTPLVEQHVGDWRTRQTWDMIDAMVEGRAAEALRQLDRLVTAGEEPIAMLGQVAHTLRNFATAGQLVKQAEGAGRRLPLPEATQRAGFPPFRKDAAARQLRTIGRARAEKLAAWLLEADLAMKGHHSSPQGKRLELERLIVRLSQAASPGSPAARR